ncbi:hypothetical protein BWR17_18125 (plasmid) [Phaeobacter inhibens]|uniref:hypothetical protein n=1 Tax=Phaeobacter inhibens TaxID=221822 RepID=UPI00097179DF|nr:hypothetical protein [Phaeobacter inhibens]APX17809.1 hypothetical protein BWR17_18125 [Phaeobacter inhibens]
MTPNHKQFEAAQREFAEQALAGLTDTAKVHFAVKVMTDTTDPQAAAALKFAAKRAEEQASILMREAFERERA